MTSNLLIPSLVFVLAVTATAQNQVPKNVALTVVVSVQAYELSRKDPLVAEAQAPTADAKVSLQKLTALVAANHAKLVAIPSTNNRSGQLSKTTDGDNELMATATIGPDGTQVELIGDFQHGGQKLSFKSSTVMGGTAYLGALDGRNKSSVQLVFARVHAQLGQPASGS